MAHWKDVLWKQVEMAYYKGGEVRICFIRRQNKRIPIVYPPTPEPIKCDEETVIDDE